MSGTRVELVVTAQTSGLQQGMQQATQEVEKLGRAGQSTGQQLEQGLTSIMGAAQRLLPVLGAAGLAGSVLQVARAGDAMTASLGRLQAATGSIQAAAQTYQDLYRISLQTGVAVSEAAGSFTRFSIAAREIGATREQVVELVRGMQMAGAVMGATMAETASATMQLGQALASGRLQGDEFRSLFEAMPDVVIGLARELGVSVAELRKMSEEGKLTAEVVFPKLLQVFQGIRTQFEAMPVTMSRSFDQLTAATGRFVAALDEALGISRNIAAAIQLATRGMDQFRQFNLPTPEERARRDADRANTGLNDARAAVAAIKARLDQARDMLLPRNVTSPDRALAAMRASDNDPVVQGLLRELNGALARQRQAEIAVERSLRRVGEFEGNAPSEAVGGIVDPQLANRRAALQQGMDGLRDRLFPREAAQRRFQSDRDDVLARRNMGLLTPAEASRQLNALQAELTRKLTELDRRGNGPEDRSPERLRDQLTLLDQNIEAERRNAEAVAQGGVAARNAEADQRAMQTALQMFPQRGAEYERALVALTDKHRRLAEAQAEGRLAQMNFSDAMQRDQLALQGSLIGASAVDRARRTAELSRRQDLLRQGIDPNSSAGRDSISAAADLAEQRLEVERNQAAYTELGRIGTQAFDRIGQAITQGTLSMRDLGRIGQSVLSELAQGFLRLAAINPLRNALMGDNLPTLGDVFGGKGGGLLGGLTRGIGGLLEFGGGGAVSPVGAITAGMPYVPGISIGLHSGGIAGLEATFLRAVPPALFHNAPRFHQGGFIGADEVPAILRRGEGVFTPEQMARLGPAGQVNAPVTIHFSGDAGNPRDREELARIVSAEIEMRITARTPSIVGEAYSAVLNDMRAGGPMSGRGR